MEQAIEGLAARQESESTWRHSERKYRRAADIRTSRVQMLLRPHLIASGLLIFSLALPLASVQHTGTIYRHHSDDPLPACGVRESSYSEIYCHSREYRAGGGDGWDSLLGLVVGCDGLATGCAAHSVRQAGRGFASVLTSLIQHAGADAASDSTLGAIWRNDCGTDDSLLVRPSGSVPVGAKSKSPPIASTLTSEAQQAK